MAYEGMPILEAMVAAKVMSAVELRGTCAGKSNVFVTVSEPRQCNKTTYIDWRARIPNILHTVQYFHKCFMTPLRTSWKYQQRKPDVCLDYCSVGNTAEKDIYVLTEVTKERALMSHYIDVV